LTQNLLMREIDVALTLQAPDHPGLKAQPLASGVLVAMAPNGHWPEATIGTPMPLQALADAPLIGLSSTDPLSARLDGYLKSVEPSPRVSISVQTYSLARAMVESGAGLAVIDPFTALGASSARTAIRPLSPPLPISLYAVTRANEAPAHTMGALLEIFASQAQGQLDRLFGTAQST
jgi:DNA-binding transcriptional LysR family regulator